MKIKGIEANATLQTVNIFEIVLLEEEEELAINCTAYRLFPALKFEGSAAVRIHSQFQGVH